MKRSAPNIYHEELATRQSCSCKIAENILVAKLKENRYARYSHHKTVFCTLSTIIKELFWRSDISTDLSRQRLNHMICLLCEFPFSIYVPCLIDSQKIEPWNPKEITRLTKGLARSTLSSLKGKTHSSMSEEDAKTSMSLWNIRFRQQCSFKVLGTWSVCISEKIIKSMCITIHHAIHHL